MNSALVFLSSLALVVPVIMGERPEAVPEEDVAQQVRIEERVIIRIAPSAPASRDRLMSLQQQAARTSYHEEKLDGCIPVSAIAGVQPAPAQNRLLLFMRDRRVLSAALEKACRPEDFYSGFYVERSRDGQLCSKREKLQSRAGASCRVSQLNRLVAGRD